MAVSFDTYDAESEIHPRNKEIPSQRLATAGLNVAYGLKEYPTNGPFPDFIDINQVQRRHHNTSFEIVKVKTVDTLA